MTARSVADLLATPGPIKYLRFWGHKPEPDGSVGRGCLSQWWPAPFTVDGNPFLTAEHYLMWRKATLFGDAEVAAKVLAAAHPHRAKALGREVRGLNLPGFALMDARASLAGAAGIGHAA